MGTNFYLHKLPTKERKQQIKNAISRINTEAQLASLVKQQNPTKLDKIKAQIDSAIV